MKKLALDAGFQKAEVIPTKGHPAVFATLDAGAKETLALYFMYDVKQAVDGVELAAWDGKLVERPGLGKILDRPRRDEPEGAAGRVPRRAARDPRRRPQTSRQPRPHRGRRGGGRLAELPGIVMTPACARRSGRASASSCRAASRSWTAASWSRSARRATSKSTSSRAAKNGAAGRQRDIHSSLAARLDQPAWRLVQALNTLVTPTGEPAVEGFFEHVLPVSAEQKAMIDTLAARLSEQAMKEAIGVKVWARDANWRQSIEDYISRPTLTIEGLVGGYSGPGGKTILPTKMTAKLDMRLVPDMTPEEVMAKLRAHLDKHGYRDIEIVKNGGVNYTSSTPRIRR